MGSKRKDVPAIISGMGVGMSIILELVKKVYDKGGTENDIHCLSTPDGSELLDKFAEMIVEANGKKSSSKKVNPQPKGPNAVLGYDDFCRWMKRDGLEQKLESGNFDGELFRRKKFFQKFYGDNYNFNWKKILVRASRLPAIEKGLEIGVVNQLIVEPIPDALTPVQANYNITQFFANEILRKSKIKIWANSGRDRWTNLTLNECFAGYINVLPEDFDSIRITLRENLPAECLRVANKKGLMPKVVPGSIEISFVDGRRDVPANQQYVSQSGEVVEVNDCSFITAVENNIKLVTPAEEIILACQLFDETGEYLARNTWEFNSALLKHSGVNPNVSVANAGSYDSGLVLSSGNADYSDSDGRFRLSL